MRKEKQEFIFGDIENFSVGKGMYEFPLEKILDSNYGRIQCNLEIHKSKKQKGHGYITEYWLWFSQTKDEKYYNKIFKFECFTESFYLRDIKVVMIKQCEIHKKQVIIFYPDNNHKKLKIGNYSSIMNNIEFI